MVKFNITKSIFYRWRYILAYGSIALIFAGLLFLAAALVPGALSSSELQTFSSSSQILSNLSLDNTPLNTPFLLLQHASVSLFGVSLIAIKLPAIIIGFLSGVLMIFLLRLWFKPGVAVLASLIVISTGQFLFLAQQGSSGILYIFWPTLLLLLATLVARRHKFSSTFKILFFIAAALSLYTPLSVYVLLALASAILLHPHLRFVIKKLSSLKITLGLICALLIILPLILTCFKQPVVLLELLGIPSVWPNLWQNLNQLALQYFGFWSLGSDAAMMPFFGLSSMLIILLGLYKLIRSIASPQSYIILAWIICLLPILIINPSFINIMFVPLLLMLTSGFELLLQTWYKLFPKNPYARVLGLTSLVILVSSMVLFGLERFVYGYRYSPQNLQNFSSDIVILPPETQKLLVDPSEEELYQAVASYRPNLQAITVPPQNGQFTATAKAKLKQKIPSKIIVNARADNSARFYLYQSN